MSSGTAYPVAYPIALLNNGGHRVRTPWSWCYQVGSRARTTWLHLAARYSPCGGRP